MTTTAEELKAQGLKQGLEQGLEQGLTRGRRESLVKLMTVKFGPLPESVTARIEGADLELLDCWLECLFTADTAEAVVESSVEG